MRDGIELARKSTPAVALVTTTFWPQGDFVASAAGMPDLPRVQLPHPVAGTGHDAMSAIARDVAPQIVAALTSASGD